MKASILQNSSFKGYINHNQAIGSAIDSYVKLIREKSNKNKSLPYTARNQERYAKEFDNLIENYQSSVEFNTLMRSDKVKKIVEKMPKDVDINEVVQIDQKNNNIFFSLYSAKVNEVTRVQDKHLARYYNCQNSNKRINADGIIAWLNNIVKYFNGTKNYNR